MKKTGMTLLLTLMLLMTGAATQAMALEKVTVLLDWFVNPDHAPLYVALERGYFTDHGLDVTIIAPSNPNDPPKLVAAGKADIAVSYQHQHQMQVDQGLPLVRIATLIATPLNALVVLADGPIHSLADLKGKTIGYSVGGFETVLLKVMLAKAGLSLADVKLVNVNFSLSPSLLTGQADAVIGAFRNFEMNQMDIEKHPGRPFYVEENGIPAYDELILVANKDRINDARLRHFVDALEEGVQYLVNHPDESWQLFIKGERKSLDDELNRRAWRDTLPRFALRPGALDQHRYKRFAEFLQEQGTVKNIPPLATWAVELP
ncbi:ABC transporter ATP-binding protein [Desulfopila sp. IMCC35006]|uniref:ABC transporter substrate-binding protein n=1 Tax=Desulfopila sp. IMCC35006 TaxID=2569542 RepID=UPI0010AC373E|nr:ABC transporter substrate-binding protein [Desulfopila sp. IMCC35006]TKB28226.1 ABC transporter ATP-binding protein [Desulfopila sp. IMCC35006]